jgi:hypothetical protein
MKPVHKKKPMKNQVTRTGKLLGGYVPAPVVEGIQKWVGRGNERDISTFIREAAREKLHREGISFQEREAA